MHIKKNACLATGFEPDDFELLEKFEAGIATEDLVDRLWRKAGRLIGKLGADLFGDGFYHADLWPEGDGDDGDRGPFLWARIKRTGNEKYATHIGVFLSPGLCNLSIDLEKDLLDAKQSGEILEQVIKFFRSDLPSMLGPATRKDLQVWTDSQNVVALDNFGSVDFTAFMNANQDSGHPWPKVGYILSAHDVEGFGDRWGEEYRQRAQYLVEVYDAMIRSFDPAVDE